MKLWSRHQLAARISRLTSVVRRPPTTPRARASTPGSTWSALAAWPIAPLPWPTHLRAAAERRRRRARSGVVLPAAKPLSLTGFGPWNLQLNWRWRSRGGRWARITDAGRRRRTSSELAPKTCPASLSWSLSYWSALSWRCDRDWGRCRRNCKMAAIKLLWTAFFISRLYCDGQVTDRRRLWHYTVSHASRRTASAFYTTMRRLHSARLCRCSSSTLRQFLIRHQNHQLWVRPQWWLTVMSKRTSHRIWPTLYVRCLSVFCRNNWPFYYVKYRKIWQLKYC